MRGQCNEYILDCIQQWGNHCSVAFFDPSCQFFSLDKVDGMIGYRATKNTAVVFGDPVCPPERQLLLTQAFHTYNRQQKKRILYIGASELFTDQLLQQKLCRSALSIGNEVILDTTIDPTAHRGADGSSLRNKWRHSIRQGLAVHEYTGYDITLEQQLEALHQRWLAGRKGPQIYLAKTDLFTHRKHRRWFYATYQNNIVGLLVLTHINAQQGFVINFLLLCPNAPTTTSEFIILSALQQLGQEASATISAGLIPQIQIQTIHGFGALTQQLIHRSYALAHKRYKLHRKHQYWNKFAPLRKKLFVLFEHPRMRMSDLISILRALHAL